MIGPLCCFSGQRGADYHRVWYVVLTQLGYDNGRFGLSDAGSFISAFKRLSDAAPLRLPGVHLHVDSIMGPIRKSSRHWRDIEPYDYRLPLLEHGAIALLGWCV